MTEHEQTDPTPAAARARWRPNAVNDLPFLPWVAYPYPDGGEEDGLDPLWVVDDAEGVIIAEKLAETDARAMIHAVNVHEQLVAALEAVVDEDDRRRGYLPADVIEQVRAALKLARGEGGGT